MTIKITPLQEITPDKDFLDSRIYQSYSFDIIVLNPNNAPKHILEFQLQDEKGTTIPCILWNDLAIKLHQYIKDHGLSAEPIIVLIKMARLSTWNPDRVDLYPRIKIQISVQDESGSASFCLFQQEVAKLLGKSAAYLISKIDKDEDTTSYPHDLDSIINRVFVFKLQVSTYNMDNNYYIFTVNKLTDGKAIIKSILSKQTKEEEVKETDSLKKALAKEGSRTKNGESQQSKPKVEHQDAIDDTVNQKITIQELRAQLFDKGSEQKDAIRRTSANTKFAKQLILGKPHSSSRPKLYAVTPLPKSTVFPKYVNGMKSRMKNQMANVSKSANQKKHKANVKKSKKSGSKESLASPSKPISFFRWLPTGRTFNLCGIIISSSNTESESDTSSNVRLQPVLQIKGSVRFNALYLKKMRNLLVFTLVDSHDVNDRVGKSIRPFVRRFIQIEKIIKLFQRLPLLLLLMHPINVSNNNIQLHLLQL
uniref:Nucleic acid-binding, OB-fold protein n=1 Tax=Tanacetum cinerariifolium TaxID=118510 RepID=A0A6L2KPU0_TANCI|nr:nucleic acid-binding, OB-fold protein [Tanacetum cinerariifolium]